jgi:hypothetical protein
LALQAFAIAFLAHDSTAEASFFGFAAEGSVAESRHVPAADEQSWIPSRTVWQSLFFSQAASGFEQVLSMHLPQSVLLSDGGGGVAAAVDSGAALAEGAVSAAGADDSDAAGAAAPSEAADVSELEEEELSEAALSAGLASPPPQASQAGGAATRKRRAAMGRRRARLMVTRLPSKSRLRIKARNTGRRAKRPRKSASERAALACAGG